MKLLLFLLCNLVCGFLMAQDCREHLLMQQGVQLEYKLYFLQERDTFNSLTTKPFSRLVMDVGQVKDSAGSTWSTIIKRGYSIYDEKKWHYEREIVLQCNGENLFFPFDFYLADTAYMVDFHPYATEGGPYIAQFTPLKDAITYIIPLVMDGICGLPEGKKQFIQTVMPGFPFHPFKSVSYLDYTFSIRGIKLESREMVITPAGTFNCYKFCMDIDEQMNGSTSSLKYWLFFNKNIGLIKIIDDRHVRRYAELTKVSGSTQDTFSGNW